MPAGRRVRLSCGLLLLSIVLVACGTPPDKEIQQARSAIDAAQQGDAGRYAHDEIVAAEESLKRAHDAVDDRDYRLALNYALDSRERAQDAVKEAADRKAAVKKAATDSLKAADAALDDLRSRVTALDGTGRNAAHASAGLRAALADGETAVQEARTTFEAGDYQAVASAMKATTETLRAAAAVREPQPAAPPKRRR